MVCYNNMNNLLLHLKTVTIHHVSRVGNPNYLSSWNDQRTSLTFRIQLCIDLEDCLYSVNFKDSPYNLNSCITLVEFGSLYCLAIYTTRPPDLHEKTARYFLNVFIPLVFIPIWVFY